MGKTIVQKGTSSIYNIAVCKWSLGKTGEMALNQGISEGKQWGRAADRPILEDIGVRRVPGYVGFPMPFGGLAREFNVNRSGARMGIPMSVGAWVLCRRSVGLRGESDVGRWACVGIPTSIGGPTVY